MRASSSHTIIRICKHVLQSGSRCRGAAAATTHYCRHHLESRLRVRRMARMRRRYPVLRPILLTDEAAIRYATVHIDAGLSSGRIDRAAGPALLWAMQMAQSVTKMMGRYGHFSSAAANSMRVTNRGKPNDFYHVPISPLNRLT